MIIYKITNKINGKSYIGQTIQPLIKRYKQHIKGKKSAISAAISKYGEDNFILEVMVIAEKRYVLDFYEIKLIAQYNTLAPNGYNLVTGGNLRKTVSDETRLRQSTSHLGKKAPWNSYKRSPEIVAEMSKRMLGNPGYWTGKTRPRSTLKLKPIKCLTTGVIYACGRDAAKALGVSPGMISSLAQGKSKSKIGIILSFVESTNG